jgi:ABC-2 type transport system ATP-binding protein
MFEIETKNLTKNFGGLVAVNNLNLQIRKGRIFGFLGPNGAGKSTTVKMLTGLLQPSSGEAIISGLSILSLPLEVKKKIGVLPEDLALFDSLTIWEHLMLCGPIYGLDRAETELSWSALTCQRLRLARLGAHVLQNFFPTIIATGRDEPKR